jgi:hypothetical protein
VKRPAADLPVLTVRQLNRATLARQLLLERARLDVVNAVERLAALQAQWSSSPYIALWSRLDGFTRERLWSAIERHRIVRARLMRGTLHLVSARDFYAYAVATHDLQRGAWNRLQIGRDVDSKKVAALATAFAREPRPKEEILAHIQERIGGKLGGPFNWLVWRYVRRARRPRERAARRALGLRRHRRAVRGGTPLDRGGWTPVRGGRSRSPRGPLSRGVRAGQPLRHLAICRSGSATDPSHPGAPLALAPAIHRRAEKDAL